MFDDRFREHRNPPPCVRYNNRMSKFRDEIFLYTGRFLCYYIDIFLIIFFIRSVRPNFQIILKITQKEQEVYGRNYRINDGRQYI